MLTEFLERVELEESQDGCQYSLGQVRNISPEVVPNASAWTKQKKKTLPKTTSSFQYFFKYLLDTVLVKRMSHH